MSKTAPPAPPAAKLPNKEGRFYFGMAIAAVATCLGLYIFPAALNAYPWWSSASAIVASALYAAFLNIADMALPENLRLRSFLKSYLLALAASLLAPVFLDPPAFAATDATGRFLSLLPILLVFGAITLSFLYKATARSATHPK